jgi:hypothetical protein
MKWRMDWQQWIESWPTLPDESHCIAFLHLDAAHDRASVRNCLEAVKPFLSPARSCAVTMPMMSACDRGVRDVFPDAEVVGERLWKVTYAHHD